MNEPSNFDDMHRRVDWLVPADAAILELCYTARTPVGKPAILTPAAIAANVGYSRKHVGNRCRHLSDKGLLEKIERGQYRLSQKGERLIDGEISPDSV